MARTIEDLEAHAAELADRFESDEWEKLLRVDASELREVATAVRNLAACERAVAEAVADARAAGHSWGAIAAMLGVSRQAAQQRYRG